MMKGISGKSPGPVLAGNANQHFSHRSRREEEIPQSKTHRGDFVTNRIQEIKTGKSFKLDVLDLIPKSKKGEPVSRKNSRQLHSRKFSEANKFESESTLQLDISLNNYQKTNTSARQQKDTGLSNHARNISDIFQNKKISFGDNINFNTNNINLNVINNNNHNNVVNTSQFSGNLTNSQISANYITGDARQAYLNKQISHYNNGRKSSVDDEVLEESSQKNISNLV